MHLKKYIGRAARFTLPAGVHQYLMQKFYIRKALSERSRGFWNIPERRHDSCLVLCNGPSVGQHQNEIVDFVADKDLITVNMFFNSDLKNKITPFIHVVADEALFASSYYDDHTEKVATIFWDKLNALRQDIFFAVPHVSYKEAVDKLCNEHIKTFSFPIHKVENYDTSYDKYIGDGALSFGAQTVAISALYIALVCGYKKIWFVGLDLDWKYSIDKFCRILRGENHYYANEPRVFHDKYHHILNLLSLVNVGNELLSLRSFAKEKNISIVNLSEASMVDIFPKGNFKGEVYPYKVKDVDL